MPATKACKNLNKQLAHLKKHGACPEARQFIRKCGSTGKAWASPLCREHWRWWFLNNIIRPFWGSAISYQGFSLTKWSKVRSEIPFQVRSIF